MGVCARMPGVVPPTSKASRLLALSGGRAALVRLVIFYGSHTSRRATRIMSMILMSGKGMRMPPTP